MRKLTVVVTCTDRKSAPPARPLMMRNLRPQTLSARGRHWAARLTNARSRYPLHALYRGAAWTETQGLVETGRRAGWDVRLLVASAGLGLRHVESEAPSYSATFSSGHDDSVANDAFTTGEWWRQLGELDQALDPQRELRGHVLLVLSGLYARAMSQDLLLLGDRGEEVLMFGGAGDVPGIIRIPSDLALRRAVGGTALSLNLRMAQAWLRRSGEGPLYDDSLHSSWSRWTQRVRHVERYERRQIDDADVMAFVAQQFALDPSVSATAALRKLRATGLACEQKRFGSLFRRAVSCA